MSDPPTRSHLVGEVRLRLPLPIVIPLAAIAIIAAFAIGFSQVLLNVEEEAAVTIALVMAANVLGAAAFVALRPAAARRSWPELLVVVLYPVIIGIVIMQTGLGAEEAVSERPRGAEEQVAGGGPVAVAAESVAFSVDTITLKADEESTIEFENKDSVQHNIAIYEDDSLKKEVFVGEVFSGPSSKTYSFTAPPPGEYYFQCDVHPTMNGTVKVE